MTDRIARRPHGKQARATYGAADAHSFTWEPVLEALALEAGFSTARVTRPDESGWAQLLAAQP